MGMIDGFGAGAAGADTTGAGVIAGAGEFGTAGAVNGLEAGAVIAGDVATGAGEVEGTATGTEGVVGDNGGLVAGVVADCGTVVAGVASGFRRAMNGLGASRSPRASTIFWRNSRDTYAGSGASRPLTFCGLARSKTASAICSCSIWPSMRSSTRSRNSRASCQRKVIVVRPETTSSMEVID